MRPQPCAENYRQERNVERGRDNHSQEEHQWVIQLVSTTWWCSALKAYTRVTLTRLSGHI